MRLHMHATMSSAMTVHLDALHSARSDTARSRARAVPSLGPHVSLSRKGLDVHAACITTVVMTWRVLELLYFCALRHGSVFCVCLCCLQIKRGSSGAHPASCSCFSPKSLCVSDRPALSVPLCLVMMQVSCFSLHKFVLSCVCFLAARLSDDSLAGKATVFLVSSLVFSGREVV